MTVARAKGAKAKADRLFSLIIRARGACERCGNTHNLQTAHIRSRRFNNTRTYEGNAFCLCATCHRYFTDHPHEFGEFCWIQLGAAAYEALRRRSESTVKMDWQQEALRLEAVWRALQEDVA